MNRNNISVLHHQSIATMNKVLKNTYLLLGATFLFSSLCAYLAVITNAAPMHPILMIFGMYGLMFLTHSLKNSPMGLVSVFAFTGFMGYSLGPIISFYTHNIPNGAHIVSVAMGGTGLLFFALSAYVLSSKRDFSFLNGFLFVASILAILAMIASVLFSIPALYLGVSAIFMLISSGLIIFQTSEIVHGGETNYIVATIGLFISIYNIFVSLLNILSIFSERD